MNLIVRFLGLLVLLLSVVCFIGCVAGIVGIWEVRQNLSEKTREIFARIEIGFERASAANRDVKRAIEKAREHVAKANAERADLPGDEKNHPPPGILERLVWQEAGPLLQDIGGRLAALSEVAVVVSSLLQTLQELPLGKTVQIDPERLERLSSRSAELSASLQKLQAMIGAKDRAVAGQENAARARDMDSVLRMCQTAVDDCQSDLDSARAELPRVEAELVGWLTLIAIAVTVLCVWVALSQISLFAHALQRCRQPIRRPGPADKPRE